MVLLYVSSTVIFIINGLLHLLTSWLSFPAILLHTHIPILSTVPSQELTMDIDSVSTDGRQGGVLQNTSYHKRTKIARSVLYIPSTHIHILTSLALPATPPATARRLGVEKKYTVYQCIQTIT